MISKKTGIKISAKDIFDKHIAKSLMGKNSDETIEIFCNLNQIHFYHLAKKYKMRERGKYLLWSASRTNFL